LDGFHGLASKPAVTVFSILPSKLVATVSPGLASKPVVGILVEPQNQGGEGFPCLGIKTGSFSLMIWASKLPRRFLDLSLKTQAGFGLLVAPQNRRREVGTGHAPRSSGLLHVEASLTMVSQPDLKTGGGTTMGDAHGTITEVALEAS
jgi:hypothetical protein